jgi:hypothetical protein
MNFKKMILQPLQSVQRRPLTPKKKWIPKKYREMASDDEERPLIMPEKKKKNKIPKKYREMASDDEHMPLIMPKKKSKMHWVHVYK